MSPNVGLLTNGFILINIKWFDDAKDDDDKENEWREKIKSEMRSNKTQKLCKL